MGKRLPLLAASALCLVAGMWAGLVWAGVSVPRPHALQVGNHAALMVGGFLGTLICAERAVASDRAWAWLAPAASALGGIFLVIGVGRINSGGAPLWPFAGGLFVFASAVLVALFAVALRRFSEPYLKAMTLGAALWLVGNVLWATGRPAETWIAWWGGFLVYTIVGERLELTRLQPSRPWRQPTFLGATILTALGLVASVVYPSAGFALTGASLVVWAVWLCAFDIAWSTIRQPGLPRYSAIALLSGYGWLGVAGIAWIFYPYASGPNFRDTALHALFLGFVMSMVFAHGPIVLPTVLEKEIVFARYFYIPLFVLHTSLMVRSLGGILELRALRAVGAAGNAVAVVAFGITVVSSLTKTGRARPTGVARQPA